MWYSPLAFSLSKRDVIGAWLMCLVVMGIFFGCAARIDRAALHGRGEVATRAEISVGKCT